MKSILKVFLLTTTAMASFGAQAVIGAGQQSFSRGPCKAQTCTISGSSATINIKENGSTKKYSLIAEGCASVGFVVRGVGDIAEVCGRAGYQRQKTESTEAWLVNKHTWSYTIKKGHSIKVKTNGKDTWSTITAPSTKGHAPRPWSP